VLPLNTDCQRAASALHFGDQSWGRVLLLVTAQKRAAQEASV